MPGGNARHETNMLWLDEQVTPLAPFSRGIFPYLQTLFLHFSMLKRTLLQSYFQQLPLAMENRLGLRASKREKTHSTATPPTGQAPAKPTALCYFQETEAGRRMHIGTSGYSYSHWHVPLSYYACIKKSEEFRHYAQEFNSVELNATFYGWFKEETFESWRQRAATARSSFMYVVKASQFYTHKKRLNVDGAFIRNWDQFWARCELLRPHLGPVLFQFPSNFKTTSLKGKEVVDNIAKLRRLGDVLPRGEKFVFEFRHKSWYCEEVYQVMRQHNWCLAIVDVHSGNLTVYLTL